MREDGPASPSLHDSDNEAKDGRTGVCDDSDEGKKSVGLLYVEPTERVEFEEKNERWMGFTGGTGGSCLLSTAMDG